MRVLNFANKIAKMVITEHIMTVRIYTSRIFYGAAFSIQVFPNVHFFTVAVEMKHFLEGIFNRGSMLL